MIRKATAKEIDQIEKSYEELLLYEQEHGAYTAWRPGVYPTRKTAEDSFADGTLYVMEEEGEVCASIIINGKQPKEYGDVQWRYDVQNGRVLVIHLLCVRPSKMGQGIGKKMVQFAIEEAKRLNCSTVRLDTGAQNKPAIALYEKLGFELAGTTSMAIGGLIMHEKHLFFERSIL